MSKTHWKKLNNPDYIGAYELMTGEENTDLVVQIVSVAKEMVTGPNNRKEECIVAKLKGQKPMILNATNSKTITKLAGSPYIEDWKGLRMTLYVARVKAFGETVDALRVRSKAPGLPELTPEHKRWASAKKSLAAGEVTIADMKKHFKISAANEKKLKE